MNSLGGGSGRGEEQHECDANAAALAKRAVRRDGLAAGRRAWRGRILRTFAVLGTIAVLFTAFNPSFLQAVFASPPSAASVTAGAANNSTAPPASPPSIPPPLPPSPNIHIPDGSITYANYTSPPSIPTGTVNVTGNASSPLTVTTSYGRFVVTRLAPFLVLVYNDYRLAGIGGFTVRLKGSKVLVPALLSSTLVQTPSGFATTYKLRSGLTTYGTMSVWYNFTASADKITAIFSPTSGAAMDYDVMWVTFTPWGFVSVPNLSQPLESFSGVAQNSLRTFTTSSGTLKELGTADYTTQIYPSPSGALAFKLDYTDAHRAYNGTFAAQNGTFMFSGYGGNVTVVAFLPGQLSIDPQYVVTGTGPFLQYSAQRKMATVGSATWLFYLNGGTIYYAYAAPSATGGTGGSGWQVVGAVPGATLSYSQSFTVAHYGKTINILWEDGSPLRYIFMQSGVVSDDTGNAYISWRSSSPEYVLDVQTTQTYYVYVAPGTSWCGPGLPCKPPTYITSILSATYASNGQLVFGYTVSVYLNDGTYGGDLVMLDRLSCGDVYCSRANSPLSEENIFQTTYDDSTRSWVLPGSYGTPKSIYVAPFQTAGGAVVAIFSMQVGTQRPDIFEHIQWVNGAGINSPSYAHAAGCMSELPVDVGFTVAADFNPSQQVAASPSGTNVELFIPSNDPLNSLNALVLTQKAPTVGPRFTLPECNSVTDPLVQLAYPSGSGEPYFMSSSTEWDGVSVDLIFRLGGGGLARLHAGPQAKAFYDAPGGNVLPWSPTYLGLWDINVEDFSSHYIFGSFDWGVNVAAFEVPSPTDFSAGPNDPWVQLPGAPGISEAGGSVNPATGMLTYSLPLVSTPVTGGAESLSALYMEPGLYYGTSAAPVVSVYSTPYDAGFPNYGYLVQHMAFLNLPWIDTARNILHLGVYSFNIDWMTYPGGVQWFNNTRGVRFNLELVGGSGGTYYLYTTSGAMARFNSNGAITRLLFPGTAKDAGAAVDGLAFNYDTNFRLATITQQSWSPLSIAVNYDAPSGLTMYQIDSITYEGGKTVTFTRPTSYSLTVTDAAGRATTLTTMSDSSWRLSSVLLPSGGSVAYTYMQNLQWADPNTNTGSIFSFPVSTMVAYNETGNIARQTQFNYAMQNAVVVEDDVKVADSIGAWQGATEYRFRSDQLMTSVRTIDRSKQVLYYDMETLSGGLLADLSGNRNNGTMSSVTAVNGQWGGAYSFCGASPCYVKVPETTSLEPAYGVSVSAWVNVNRIPGSDGAQMIVDNSYPGGPNNQGGYFLAILTGGQVQFGVTGATTSASAVSSTALSLSTWNFVAGSYDGHTVSIYVNGVLSGTAQYATPMVYTSVVGMGIGVCYAIWTTGGCRWLNGIIDEVHVSGRGLSQDEVGSLFRDNVIQTKLVQNWYSANAQPHVVDEFDGYGTPTGAPMAASATSMNYVDDWGNVIYTRDAYGREKFASFNNTNHQGEFYAPARLDRTGSGLLYSGTFDYGNDMSPYLGLAQGGSATLDYTNFGRYAPSLKLSLSTSGTMAEEGFLTAGTQTPAVEFRAYIEDTNGLSSGNEFDFYALGTTGLTVYQLKFVNGAVSAYTTNGGLWTACGSYAIGTWYTFSMYLWGGSAYVLKNNAQQCAMAASSAYVYAVQPTLIRNVGTYTVHIDDVRVSSSYYITLNGLYKGNIVRVQTPDGSIIEQFEVANTGTVTLNDVVGTGGHHLTFGDLIITIYGVDGTLEYVSPRTDFNAGDTYTFVRPVTTMQRFVGLRSGFQYWTGYGNNGNSWRCVDAATGASCANYISTAYGLPARLPSSSFTLGGLSQDPMVYSQISSPAPLTYDASQFLTWYAYAPTPQAVPLSAGFGGAWAGASYSTLYTAFWGFGGPSNTLYGNAWSPNFGTNKFMGALATNTPTVVYKMIVKEPDLFNNPASGTINGWFWQQSGGNAYFSDAWISADAGQMWVKGTPVGSSVGVYWANNDTGIASASGCGTSCQVALNLYPKITVFPVSVKFKVTDAAGNAVYYSAPTTIWGGDYFTYIGGGEFYDQVGSTSADTQAYTIHNAPTGTLARYGDYCANGTALVCYDMESLQTVADSNSNTGSGAVGAQVMDLSGNGNGAPLASTTQMAPPSQSASGLGLSFDASVATAIPFTATGINTGAGQYVMVSFWMYWTGGNNQMPVSFAKGPGDATYLYDLFFSSPCFGFNTGVSDCYGINTNNVPLANKLVHVVAVFYNGNYLGNNQIWINGVQQTLTQIYGSQNIGRAVAQPLAQISGWQYGAGYNFGGAIDQFAIYNGQFGPRDIVGLYRARYPNAGSSFTLNTNFGMPAKRHVLLNGQYAESVYKYDTSGFHDLVGSSLNGNQTSYNYSKLYGGAYLTETQRPDGYTTYTSYDAFTGNLVGTLDPNCRQTRYVYDALDRRTRTVSYDTDSSTVFWLDMATTLVSDAAQNFVFKDISCTAAQPPAAPGMFLGGTIGQGAVAPGPNPLAASAQNFDGASYIQVFQYNALNVGATTGSITMSAWIRPYDINSAHPILEYGANGQTHWGVHMWQFGSGTPGKSLYANFADTSGVNHGFFSSTTVFNAPNVWYFVAAAYDHSSGYGYLYVNGTLVGSANLGVFTLETSYFLNVGYRPNGVPVYYVGYITEPRVFNAALPQGSIQSLMAGAYKQISSATSAFDDSVFPSATAYSADSIPRSLYFDMSTGKIGQTGYVEDLSGSGNNGQEVGSGLLAVPGIVGNAIQFPGSANGYMLVPNSPTLSPTGNRITLSFWAEWLSFPPGDGTCGAGSSSAIPIGKGSASTSYLGSWWFELRTTGDLDLYMTMPGPTYVQEYIWANQPLNQFHHYTATYDGQNVRAYRDGALLATVPETRTLQQTSYSMTIAMGYATGACGSKYTNAVFDEIQLLPTALTSAQVSALYNGYPPIPPSSGTLYKAPTGYSTTATDCVGDASGVNGAWTNPTYAYAWDNLSATASPGKNKLFCDEWNTFGFSIPTPAGATVTINSVTVTAAWQVSSASIASSLHVGLLTSNGGTNCAVQQDATLSTTQKTSTFDFTSCKAWSPADFNGNAIKVDVGAHQSDGGQQTFSLDYVFIKVAYTISYPSPNGQQFDPTHMTRTYYDGLGRPVRRVSVDLYGHVLTTAQTMGWNDRPTAKYTTSGQRYQSAYNFLGAPVMTITPLGGIAAFSYSYVSPSATLTDEDGHVATTAYDLLGRVAWTGVYNPAAGNYNLTTTTYNYLGQPAMRQVKQGGTILQTWTYYYNAAGELVWKILPDGGNMLYTYDGDLRPYTTTDPMGRIAVTSYTSTGNWSKMGKVSQVAYLYPPSGASLCYASTFTYDAMGNLARAQNGTESLCGSALSAITATVTRTYDNLYRLQSEQVNAGVLLNEVFAYDTAGRITQISYPQNQGTTGYVYDSLGRASAVTFNGTTYVAPKYDQYGHLNNLTYPQAGGWYSGLLYDALNRPIQQNLCPPGGPGYGCSFWIGGPGNAVYDAAGLLVQVGNDNMGFGAKTSTFAYDSNGRLISASGPFSTRPLSGNDDQTGWVNYSYDAVGNVLKRQDSDLGTCAQSCVRWDSGQTVTYGYAGTYDEITSSTGKIAESFGYNGNGAMTSRSVGGWTYTYDYQQHLVNAASGSNSFSYFYDGLGRRASEIDTVGGTYTTYYAYGSNTLLYALNGTRASSFVYLGDLLLFRKDSGSTTVHYYAQDAIVVGNVRAIWSYTTSMQVEAKFRYKPFGELATPLVPPSGDPRFRYASQDYAGPTKLYHMGARYYAPDLGRFTSRDPVGAHDYSYALDNPMSFRDPSGRFVFLIILAAVLIGAAVGGGAYAYHFASTPGASWNWGQFGLAVGIGALGGLAAGATFGLGAAALGVTSIAELSTVGYGATFLLGGVAGLNAYHAEQIAHGAVTGHATWDPREAAVSFISGGAFAAGGKALGEALPRLRAWWNGQEPAPVGELPEPVAAFFERQDAMLRSWEFYNAPYSLSSSEALGDFMTMVEGEPTIVRPPYEYPELYWYGVEQVFEDAARTLMRRALEGEEYGLVSGPWAAPP